MQFFSVQDAAQHFGVHTNTIYNAIKAGHLPCVRVGRKVIRIPREALEAWQQAQLQGVKQ